MVATEISLENAKQDKLFYFVANVVVYRDSDGKCLILKRDEREKVHPGKYGVMGGKLEWGDMDLANPTRINGDVLDYEDAVEKLLIREVKEEAGINVHPEFKYLDSMSFVRPDGVPVVFLRFGARYASGEVVLEEGGFTEHAWVDAEEVKNYPCIRGIDDGVEKTIALFSNKLIEA
jgi:8-oxo-dGTP pyrophosphatase MutT (NUDIX family)